MILAVEFEVDRASYSTETFTTTNEIKKKIKPISIVFQLHWNMRKPQLEPNWRELYKSWLIIEFWIWHISFFIFQHMRFARLAFQPTSTTPNKRTEMYDQPTGFSLARHNLH